ncbi:hypothetical protein A3J23_02380 [Candidatus Peregrinibacteria bacterium RIFCSPLOWO2_02_FULL_48_14]|nr:MAG: hypothetical protein UY05_C0056G0006 [Candidatus Peregrinibacteria bacterium GW2011_GWA2_47_7]OGJ45926.1 MAG: hypothetical protein A3J23_02380 [Candidatus Peregrinibacteria bacterium RIFCSPLOWO2_02_FULL_48_14]
MFNKNFLLFWIITGIFLILVSVLLFFYLGYDDELPTNGVSVDISLPVVEWDDYLQLSKSLK